MPCQGNTHECLSKLEAASSLRKMIVTCKSPVGDISAVTLIRTDTTLDHSQKAEKVCLRSEEPQILVGKNVTWVRLKAVLHTCMPASMQSSVAVFLKFPKNQV